MMTNSELLSFLGNNKDLIAIDFVGELYFTINDTYYVQETYTSFDSGKIVVHSKDFWESVAVLNNIK